MITELILASMIIIGGMTAAIIAAHRQQSRRILAPRAIEAPRRKELPAPARPMAPRPVFVLPDLDDEPDPDGEDPAEDGEPCERPDCDRSLPAPPQEPWEVRVTGETRRFCSGDCANAWVEEDRARRVSSGRRR